MGPSAVRGRRRRQRPARPRCRVSEVDPHHDTAQCRTADLGETGIGEHAFGPDVELLQYHVPRGHGVCLAPQHHRVGHQELLERDGVAVGFQQEPLIRRRRLESTIDGHRVVDNQAPHRGLLIGQRCGITKPEQVRQDADETYRARGDAPTSGLLADGSARLDRHSRLLLMWPKVRVPPAARPLKADRRQTATDQSSPCPPCERDSRAATGRAEEISHSSARECTLRG